MHSLAIILLSVLAAVVYGIVHDQVTARVCIEYFTIYHAPIFGTEDPTLLGLAWGVWATWWMGLFLGIPLAVAARTGSRPKRTAGSLVRPIALLLVVMACCALIAGVVGWLLAHAGVVAVVGPMAEAVPPEKHVAFLADMWAHSASYFIGFFGGIVLIAYVWHSRRPATPAESQARNRLIQ